MIKAIYMDCGCFYEDKDEGPLDHRACMKHSPLSFGRAHPALAQTAREFPRGTVAQTMRASGAAAQGTARPCCKDSDHNGTPATLVCDPKCSRAKLNCIRCGQECLPDGTCHCGATPIIDHTLCDKLFTLGERRALRMLLTTEQAELISERRMLVGIRATRRDDSWEGRIKDIDTKEAMLRAMINKVRL